MVPSQTDAAIKSTSDTIAPMPGEGDAADCARRIDSSMVGLRRWTQELLLGLLFAQIVVANDKVRQHKAQRRANGPRHDNAPENPIREAENVGQRGDVAAVAQAVTDADRINGGREPNRKHQQRLAAGVCKNGIFASFIHRLMVRSLTQRRKEVYSDFIGLRLISLRLC